MFGIVRWFNADEWRKVGDEYIFNIGHIFNDRYHVVDKFFYRTNGKVEIRSPSEFRYPWYAPLFDEILRLKPGQWAAIAYRTKFSPYTLDPIALKILSRSRSIHNHECTLTLYMAKDDGVKVAYWTVSEEMDRFLSDSEIKSAYKTFRELGLGTDIVDAWVEMCSRP
jgi:hypothetical protein